MKKPYIGYIVAPAAFRPTLQALAEQLGDGGNAERDNFSVGFCLATAPNTIVAYGGSTGPISQAVVDYLETNVIPSLPAGAFWMLCANEDYPARVLKTNYTPSQKRINDGGTVTFDLESILAKLGMVLHSQPLQG